MLYRRNTSGVNYDRATKKAKARQAEADSWVSKVKYLDTQGNVVKSLDDGNQPAVDVFHSAIRQEVTRVGNAVTQEVRNINLRKYSSKDIAQSLRLLDDPKAKVGKRARQLLNMYERMSDEKNKRLNYMLASYAFLAPHTHCFTPATIPASNCDDVLPLDEVLRRLQDMGSYDVHPTWRSSKNHILYRYNNHTVKIKGLVHTERPDFKIKVQATHRVGEVIDRLDYELRFTEDRFWGVAHYDVDKSYTFSVLHDEVEWATTKEARIYFSLSDKTLRVGYQESEKRYRPDALGKWFAAATQKMWREHPEIVGGMLATDIVAGVQHVPAFAKLQQIAIKNKDKKRKSRRKRTV